MSALFPLSPRDCATSCCDRLARIAARIFIGCALFTMIPAAAMAAGTLLVGNQQIGALIDGNPAGVAEAFQASAIASGFLDSIAVYVDSTSTATVLAVGIYADASGTPGALLAQSTLNAPAKGAWNSLAV